MAVASSFSTQREVRGSLRQDSGPFGVASVAGEKPGDAGVPEPRENRSGLNVHGAFPLILIGAVLLTYGIALALQSPTPTIDRFEVWEMVVVVATTLLGSGIFSLFYATEGDSTAPTTSPSPSTPADVPDRRPSPLREKSSAKSAAGTPPWWEGPVPPSPSPPRTVVARTENPRPAASGFPAAAASVPAPPPVESPAPNDSGRDEIESALKELEAISRDITTAPVPTPSKPGARRSSTERCSDCGRTLTPLLSGRICVECGRPLCPNCGQPATGGPPGAMACQRCQPVRA